MQHMQHMQQHRWAAAQLRIFASHHVAPQDAELAKALQTTNEGQDPRLPDLGMEWKRVLTAKALRYCMDLYGMILLGFETATSWSKTLQVHYSHFSTSALVESTEGATIKQTTMLSKTNHLSRRH